MYFIHLWTIRLWRHFSCSICINYGLASFQPIDFLNQRECEAFVSESSIKFNSFENL